MAIASGQALLICALAGRGIWQNIDSVCELGAQTPIHAELSKVFEVFGVQSLEQPYTAKQLYQHLGVKRYTSIDFSGEAGARPFDLNRNIVAHYDFSEKFELVTNFGTSSAVFNQFEIFKNIHELCHTGGYMIHTLPAQGWGGRWFFKYSTNFIEDLAAANDYEVIFLEPFLRLRPYEKTVWKVGIQQVRRICDFVESTLAIANSNVAEKTPIDLIAQQDVESLGDLRRALADVGMADALFNVTLACALRKTTNGPFVSAILSMYQHHLR